MTTDKIPATLDAVRNLIVCDTQFGWNGETTLKAARAAGPAGTRVDDRGRRQQRV
ncbi:hypothetical protein ACQ5SA_00315 [Stenotrophomonas indicatrix]